MKLAPISSLEILFQEKISSLFKFITFDHETTLLTLGLAGAVVSGRVGHTSRGPGFSKTTCPSNICLESKKNGNLTQAMLL